MRATKNKTCSSRESPCINHRYVDFGDRNSARGNEFRIGNFQRETAVVTRLSICAYNQNILKLGHWVALMIDHGCLLTKHLLMITQWSEVCRSDGECRGKKMILYTRMPGNELCEGARFICDINRWKLSLRMSTGIRDFDGETDLNERRDLDEERNEIKQGSDRGNDYYLTCCHR